MADQEKSVGRVPTSHARHGQQRDVAAHHVMVRCHIDTCHFLTCDSWNDRPVDRTDAKSIYNGLSYQNVPTMRPYQTIIEDNNHYQAEGI